MSLLFTAQPLPREGTSFSPLHCFLHVLLVLVRRPAVGGYLVIFFHLNPLSFELRPTVCTLALSPFAQHRRTMLPSDEIAAAVFMLRLACIRRSAGLGQPVKGKSIKPRFKTRSEVFTTWGKEQGWKKDKFQQDLCVDDSSNNTRTLLCWGRREPPREGRSQLTGSSWQ